MCHHSCRIVSDRIQKLSFKLQSYVVVSVIITMLVTIMMLMVVIMMFFLPGLSVIGAAQLDIIDLSKRGQVQIIGPIDTSKISLVCIESIQHSKRLQCFIQIHE